MTAPFALLNRQSKPMNQGARLVRSLFQRSTVLLVTLSLFVCIQPVLGCTIFTASDGFSVLAGNNEDWHNVDTYIQFVPASEGKNGQMYFGTDDWYAEGGMNTEGLFYDAAALSAVDLNVKPLPILKPPITTPIYKYDGK